MFMGTGPNSHFNILPSARAHAYPPVSPPLPPLSNSDIPPSTIAAASWAGPLPPSQTLGHTSRTSSSSPPSHSPPSPDATTLHKWFCSIDRDGDGLISPTELQESLARGGVSFSLSTAAHFIRQCEASRPGFVTFAEFPVLHHLLDGIQESFRQADSDHDGILRPPDVSAALDHAGYRIDPPVLTLLLSRFDPTHQGGLSMQEFAALCLLLRGCTSTYRAFDPTGSGTIKLTFNQFLYAAGSVV